MRQIIIVRILRILDKAALRPVIRLIRGVLRSYTRFSRVSTQTRANDNILMVNGKPLDYRKAILAFTLTNNKIISHKGFVAHHTVQKVTKERCVLVVKD
jgi:hypothetical protein